ncbi:MAG: hypothetical protein SV910_08645 [Chloroflexota bacterium]|nr:hypothetical protein [Chloroflexota bacterium]
MSALDTAIAQRRWELVALCLLLGAVQALSQLPADSVEGLIDVLSPQDEARGE